MSAEQVALDHYRGQRRLADAAAEVAGDAWQQVDPENIAGSWGRLSPEVTVAVAGAQQAAAQAADGYLDAVLSEQGLSQASAGGVAPAAFAGVASDGRPLASLLDQPRVGTLAALAGGHPVDRSMALGRASLDMIVRTQVADAGRTADQVSLVAHRAASGYARLLVPPSCSRCAILAGKFFRYNAGFQRHPRCDCRHIPSVEATVGDLRVNPRAYFDSLSQAEQDRIFTIDGARAIRDGADLSQVVNARRGMRTAALYGRNVAVTTEGTTVRGLFGGYEIDPDTGQLRRRASEELVRRRSGSRFIRAARAPRLMPEEIYRAAGSREDAIRLLRRNGYLRAAPASSRAAVRPAAVVPARPAATTFETRIGVAASDDAALAAARAGLGRRRPGDVALTRAERDALRDYQSSFFTAVNGQLRAADLSGAMQRTVSHIDGAMRPLAAEVAVWRGLGNARPLFGDRIDGDLTGLEWAERAYLSTTAVPRVARGFGADGAGDRVLMRILAPEGTGAVRISGSGIGEQAEILMQRGLTLRVARDRGVQPDGHRLLDVEVARLPATRPVPAARPAPAAEPAPPPRPSRDWSGAVTGEEAWQLAPPLSDALFRGSRAAPANRIRTFDRARYEQVLVNYTGSIYPDLQRAARTGQGAPELLQTVDDLDRLLRNTALRADLRLYRGIQNPQVAIPGWPASGTAEGLEWTAAGFNSTTGLREVAEQFARGEVPGAGAVTEPVVMTVLTPAGTPALQLGVGIGEVLLPRNITLRVIRDEGTVNGVRRITVEVVTR